MYDAVIIGAGPAGYVCAISLARQGAKVCVVEKNGLGGTCTQRGCIPTKYLHSMGDIIRKAKSAKKFVHLSEVQGLPHTSELLSRHDERDYNVVIVIPSRGLPTRKPLLDGVLRKK